MAINPVTLFTAARQAAIEAQAIVGGSVVNNRLILTRNNGQTIDAGYVKGDPGTMTLTELDARVQGMFTGTAADIARSPALNGSAGSASTKAARSDHVHPAPVWLTYTPTWINTGGTNPTIGNGSLTGRYLDLGKTIIGGFNLTIGSTTTLGTAGGRWDFTLPTETFDGSTFMPLGQVVAYNGARFWRAELLNYGAVSRCYAWRDNVSNESSFTPSSPFAWAAGNYLKATFIYERK